MKLKALSILVFIALMSSATLVMAQDVVVPNVFSSGERIYANQMNENFDVLRDGINSKAGLMLSVGYSKTPTVRGVTISSVTVNGGMITAPVEAGSKINIEFLYHIVDKTCPGCIDQIQVGFAHLKPVSCVYDGIPGSRAGKNGTAKFSIVAPAEPGVYHIGVDRSQAFSCPANWWNSAPTTSNRWIAAITVR